jgi:hypothetical protein
MKGMWDPQYRAWLSQQNAQGQRTADAKAAGGIRMSDGNWYMPDEVEINDRGEYSVKGKPGLTGQNPDGSPMRPQVTTVVDKDGNLKPGQAVDFQGVDSSKLEGYNLLKNMATGQGPTDVANAESAQADLRRSRGLDTATAAAAGAAAQARTQLGMRGGASSGARAGLARASLKDLLSAKMGVNSDYSNQLADIGARDANRKLDLTKNFSAAEMEMADKNAGIENQQTEFNKQLQGYGIDNSNKYRMDAYTSELDKWGAGRQADATRASSSGGGGGGGCCFILLEARYGNGTMDEVVRRYRDEHMSVKNKRGYYKLAEVVVPLMRKSKAFKFLICKLMADPLVAYGKAHYGPDTVINKSKRLLLSPVKTFWLKLFDYLGEEHAFVRENGEVV